MNPSTEIAVLERGVDRIALEKKRAAGMPRRVTRITELCVPSPPPHTIYHRATLILGRHTGTEKNVCDLREFRMVEMKT